jgi:transitional endoplasmic reticulum ATPase
MRGEVGESERVLRLLFTQALHTQPAIIFIDEVQATFGKRGAKGVSNSDISAKMVCTLLSCFDLLHTQMNTRVLVLGATNSPQSMDSALLAPGRFERCIYVPPPDAIGREEILLELKKQQPTVQWHADVTIPELVKMTDGFSGVDLSHFLLQAGRVAIRRNISAECITQADFQMARQTMHPSINPAMIQACQAWQSRFEKRKLLRNSQTKAK